MASKEPAAEENGGCNTETEEETIALQKKRSRRVSFAETTAIHLFTRDDEYETPPDDAGNPSSEDEDKLRRSESDEIMELLQSSDDDDDNVGAVKSSFLRPMESPSPGSGFGSATSNDEDNFFGPVSMDFIRPGRLSDSAASDENHDITMDSTAFSMHFRSLAKSDSGGDFKTPTGIRLAFDERTSGQISTANSLGDLMDLTMGRKPVSHSSFPADKVNDSGYSDEMSVVSENSLRYDYAKLPPELDVLLAEGSKDVGAVSLNGQVSSLKKVTVSALDKNRHELLDIAHNKDADITLVPGEEKSSGDEAISTADLNFNEKIDDVTHASVILGEAPYNKSDNLYVDPVTVLPIHDQGTPFDEEGKSRKRFIEASGIFESPSSRTLSNLNHEQPLRSFVAGSVSSLLAKRRKIFKASTNQSNDEWNLILLAKEFSDKGSIKHVWSTSRFAKGVSRLRRLENFPYASTSKAEGATSKLFPPSQFPISTSKNIFLGNSNSCNTVENCVDVPVVCLEARFSDVATDKGDFKSTMDNNVLKLVGNKEFARDTEEVKDVSLSSFSGMPFPEKSRKVVNASNTHSFPGSQMNRLDHHILKDNNAKATQQLMRSDSILPDVTFDKDNTKTGMSNNYDFSSKIWMSDNSVFSSNKGLEKLASSQYQEKLSINLIQPCQSHLRLDRDVGQKEEVVYASRTEDATSSLSDRKEKNNVLSSDFEHPNCVAQEKQSENLLLSNQSGLATSMCFQSVLDKDSESCELYSLTDDVQTGRMLTSKAQLAQSVESIAGSSEGFDGPNKLPTQRPPESPIGELSFSLLHKEPCAMVDDEHMHLVREDAPTPTPNKLTNQYDKDDSLSKTQSYVWAIDSSSGRKRKLGGVVDGTERQNGGVLSFQPKLQLCKDQNHLQVGSEVSCSVGVTVKLRRWDDVFSSLCGMTKQLLSPSIDKHALALVEKLDDILVHLEKVKSYEHLYQSICSQKSSDPAYYLQNKRVLDLKSLLNKILYKKANLQLLHLKQGRLLGQIQQLNAKIQVSETLTSNFFCPRVFAQTDTRAANIHTESHPKDIEDTSLAPVELSQLKAELEVSGRKMKNLRDSFYAYFKVIEEPTGTNITEYAKDFLVKRVSCRSMLSELQLLEIESLKMQNGRQNFIFNHCGFLFQSLNLSSTSALSISKELNNLKISKMFYNMDACTAFAFVFGSERILMYSGVRTIAQETQKTNSVLHTLLDVVEEVELAMMELTNLTHSRFSQPSAGRLDLQLCFTDFKSGARVNLSIDVTCLSRGVYPSETIPYEVQGRAARNENSLEILLSNVRTGFKGLRCGYMRIINLCRCVSNLMQNSLDMT